METYVGLRRRARRAILRGPPAPFPRPGMPAPPGSRSCPERPQEGAARRRWVMLEWRTGLLGTEPGAWGPRGRRAAQQPRWRPPPRALRPKSQPGRQLLGNQLRKPRESFRPATAGHYVFCRLSSPQPGKVSFWKNTREKSPVSMSGSEAYCGDLLWGGSVFVQRAKPGVFNFRYLHFRYLK